MRIHRFGGFIWFLLFFVVFTSCHRQERDGEMPSATAHEVIAPPMPRFAPDFAVKIGVRESGHDLFSLLDEGGYLMGELAQQTLLHPDFPVLEERGVVRVAVISLLEMGFGIDELVTIDIILRRGEEIGLEVCPPELAAELRLKFNNQPEFSTGNRLGEFFVAHEPISLNEYGVPVIFIVARFDPPPLPNTLPEKGLWLYADPLFELSIFDDEGGISFDEGITLPNRQFDPLDPDGYDLGGKFAFIVPYDDE